MIPSLNDLRRAVADTLWQEKAYALPGVCDRLGMPRAGPNSSAQTSKRAYVLERLAAVPRDGLIRIAHEVLKEHSSGELEAILGEIDPPKNCMSEVTRRAICRGLSEVDLSGHLEISDFLRRVWPIDSMPSRYGDDLSLAHDIVRHTILNPDWRNEDLFRELGVYACPQRQFAKFLEELVHPLVRNDEGQRYILEIINPLLQRDGLALTPASQISGHTVYEIRPVGTGGSTPADHSISVVLSTFDAEGVHHAWTKAAERRETDPEGAITMARTLLETVCKRILDEADAPYKENEELPKLYRLTAERLNLAPDQHAAQMFREILGNCQAVVSGLAGLRNRFGDAHGKGRHPVRPSPRHAQLAVNLAGTMATFLIETYLSQSMRSA